jgi:hypothetical protein
MKGATLIFILRITLIILLLLFVSVIDGRRQKDSKSRRRSDNKSHDRHEHSSAKLCSVNKCNNNNLNKVRYYADPSDQSCRRFCECAHGIPYRFTCHEPLLFNPKINVCDWPNKVNSRAAYRYRYALPHF